MLRCELTPLSLKDTAAYISGAGEDRRRRSDAAVHPRRRGRDSQHSKGIPRVISVICDNALVNGFAADQKPVGASIVAEVCRSLALTAEEHVRRGRRVSRRRSRRPQAAAASADVRQMSGVAASRSFRIVP